MPKFRKKPVVIDAEVYRPGLEDGFILLWPNGKIFDVAEPWETVLKKFNSMFRDPEVPHTGEPEPAVAPAINTLEGAHVIREGDYIITGVAGERYPCKPDIFAATYEPAE